MRENRWRKPSSFAEEAAEKEMRALVIKEQATSNQITTVKRNAFPPLQGESFRANGEWRRQRPFASTQTNVERLFEEHCFLSLVVT